MVTTDEIITLLKTVKEPNLARDIVSLGMVHDVKVVEDTVQLAISLQTEGCSPQAKLKQLLQEAFKDVDVGTVHIEFITANSTVDELPNPLQSKKANIKNIVAVGSGKGGVGKSTVTANLAAALQQLGATVGVLDADIYGPSQAHMFSVAGRRLLADEEKNIIPLKNYGIKVLSIANLVADGQALSWRGPMLHGTLTQMLQQTFWGTLDYLLIDLPPGTGDVQLSLSQLATLTGAVLVTTPQDVALMDVRRAYTMFKKTHVPVLGMVENMAYYELPDGSRDYVFGEGGAQAYAEEIGIPCLGTVPINRNVRESGDAGKPLVLAEPEDSSSLVFIEIAKQLAQQVNAQNMMTLPVL